MSLTEVGRARTPVLIVTLIWIVIFVSKDSASAAEDWSQLMTSGRDARVRGQLVEAEEHYTRALAEAERERVPIRIEESLHALGAVMYEAERWESAHS